MSNVLPFAGVRGTSHDDPSGRLAAQAAHDAGAVEPAVELPRFSLMATCTLRCDEQATVRLRDELVAWLLARDEQEGIVAISVAADEASS